MFKLLKCSYFSRINKQEKGKEKNTEKTKKENQVRKQQNNLNY
jgi:hypothetical protein